MALRGIQEYIARDVNNIARVEDEGNIVIVHFKRLGSRHIHKEIEIGLS